MSRIATALLTTSLVVGTVLLAGCGTPTPAPTAPGGGPGGPGGGPGGPGRRGPGGGGAITATSGPEIYQQACQNCHGPEGKGGNAPQLAGAQESTEEMKNVILNGEGRKMPSFKDRLQPAQVDTLVSYLKGLKG